VWPVSKNPTRTVGFPLRHVAKANDQNTPPRISRGRGGYPAHDLENALEYTARTHVRTRSHAQMKQRRPFITISERTTYTQKRRTIGRKGTFLNTLRVLPCVCYPACVTLRVLPCVCYPACVTSRTPHRDLGRPRRLEQLLVSVGLPTSVLAPYIVRSNKRRRHTTPTTKIP